MITTEIKPSQRVCNTVIQPIIGEITVIQPTTGEVCEYENRPEHRKACKTIIEWVRKACHDAIITYGGVAAQ